MMPITYQIDRERRLVVARGYGSFTDSDAFAYQRSAWSGKDVVGFYELVDMTLVTDIVSPSPQRVQDLASVAAQMDLVYAPSRLAIVAPEDVVYELGRMYQSYRDRLKRSTKEVAVFRTLVEAWTFLDVKNPPPLPPLPPEA